MAVQLSVAARNIRLDAVEIMTGPNPLVVIRSGAQPGSTDDPDSGIMLGFLILGEDWCAPASGGTKAVQGLPADGIAVANGTAAHFRMFKTNAPGVNCVMQGSVSAVGGGGDLQLDNAVIAAGQKITLTSLTFTDANA